MFLLQGVHFAVFGLGNTQYEHFCAVGKAIQTRLSQGGATSLVRLGEGDDDKDIDVDFDNWSADLFAALDKSDVCKTNVSGVHLGLLAFLLFSHLFVNGPACTHTCSKCAHRHVELT